MKAMNDAWKYAEPLRLSRTATSSRQSPTHHGVKPENILLTAGSGEVLEVVGTTFLQDGKKVLGVEPSYSSVYQHATSIKADAIKLPLRKDYRAGHRPMIERGQQATPRDMGFSTCATRTTRPA